MKLENLSIISNEKTQFDGKNYFCDNIDMKSISEGLSKNFKVELFVRKSKTERNSHQINIQNISMSNGIISFFSKIIKSSKIHNKYLIISITPYTFIVCLLLFILKKNVFLYLRSNGYEEYRCYSKYFGPFIYHIMFSILAWKAKLLSCRPHILKGKKGIIVSPSQLNEKWFLDRKPVNSEKIRLLYVGRIKPEKGIVSLLKILKKINLDFKISIINPEKNYDKNLENDKVKILNFKNENDAIIKVYDDHNIFILPSFTEGHPQVLDESLSRLRPVIVFPEISHVVRDRKGVFISERSPEALSEKIKTVMQKYQTIQEEMKTNKLPTKKNFLVEITDIINHNKKI